jgi:alanine-alpha-ketoisovalerate/valine-pyruvate aminotransferase
MLPCIYKVDTVAGRTVEYMYVGSLRLPGRRLAVLVSPKYAIVVISQLDAFLKLVSWHVGSWFMSTRLERKRISIFTDKKGLRQQSRLLKDRSVYPR